MKAKRASAVVILVLLLISWVSPFAQEDQEREKIKPVLLVVDVQNQWMPMMSKEDLASAPAKINEAIALFRKYGQPVIRVYHSDPKRGPEPGTEAFEFADSIAVLESDAKVVKAHPSSFQDTDLETMLMDGERNVVILCGLSAVGCVLATYFGATERDFTVLMVKEALLSHNAEYTDMVENICYSMSLEDLKEMLEDPYF